MKFGAWIHVGKTYRLGSFETALEAAKVFDAGCLLLGVRDRMNFTDADPGADAIDLARVAIFPPVEKYHGVKNVGKAKSRFLASVYAGRMYLLGKYATALEAAKVYDAACMLLGKRKRNFPDADPGADAIEAARQVIFPVATSQRQKRSIEPASLASACSVADA
jgi:hypothetical protein